MTRVLRQLGWLMLALPLPFVTVACVGSRRALAVNLALWCGGLTLMFLVAAGPGAAIALLAVPHAWWTSLARHRI